MNFEQKETKATKTQRVLLRSLRYLLFSSLLAFSIQHLAFPLSAQPPPQKENRFLFIINTSSAMRRMTNGIQAAVLGLLKSEMQGQMRDGDTFGLWTYDDQLHTGFPMQVWSKQNQNAIVQTATNYLAQSRYQNRPRLDKVLPAARQLIAQSRVITLIFIFDGSETMQGTPFDKDINDLHKEFGRQMRADNIPFVTVLAARDGHVFDYKVRTPSSAAVPPTADLFNPAETNAVATLAATNPPPPAAVAPKPPEPRHLDIVLRPTVPPSVTPVGRAGSPLPAAESPPVTPVQPAPATVQPPTTAAVASVESANPQSAIRNPQLPAAAPPKAEEPPRPSPNLPRQSEATAGQSTPNPIAAPEPPPPPVAPVGRAASPLAAAAPDNPPPPIETVAVPPVVPASNPQSAPSSVALAEEEIRPPSPGLRRPGNPQSVAAPPVPTPHPAPPAVSTAVALPSRTDHLALLVIAISLVTIAVVLILFLIRRSRAAPSLISQSMDRSH